MGLFDKMKSIVGIGAPVLKIEPEAATFSIHGRIRGMVTITAQERETPVASITVTLVCEKDEKLSDGSTMKRTYEHGQCRIELQGRLLPPGYAFPESFEITIVGLTAIEPDATYRLVASADTPGLDPRGSIDITLSDAPPMAPDCNRDAAGAFAAAHS